MTLYMYNGYSTIGGIKYYKYVSAGGLIKETTVWLGDTYDDGIILNDITSYQNPGSEDAYYGTNPTSYVNPTTGDAYFPIDYVSDTDLDTFGDDVYSKMAAYYVAYDKRITELKAQIAGLSTALKPVDPLDSSQAGYYDLPSKIINIQNTLNAISVKTGNTYTEMKAELTALKGSIVSLASIQSLVAAEGAKRASAEANIQATVDAIKAANAEIKAAELKTYEEAVKIKDSANQIHILLNEDLSEINYDVNDINSSIQRVEKKSASIVDAYEYALNEVPRMNEITDKLNIMFDNLSQTVIPQAIYNTAMLIPNLSQPVDSEKFLATVDQLKNVADILEMAGVGYIIAKASFQQEDSELADFQNLPDNWYNWSAIQKKQWIENAMGDPYGRMTFQQFYPGVFADFNSALTEFRTGINLINNLAKNKSFYGAYFGGGGQWEYSSTKREGFLKSRYGNYYVRKRLS